jgi:hypothetical protein
MILGRGGSSHGVGDAVTVVYDPADPRRAWFAVASELVGGGIASMLFGTFPVSAGLFFLLEGALGDRGPRGRDLTGRRTTPVRNVLRLGGILWMVVMDAPVEELFLEGFAIVSAGLWVHYTHGLVAHADPRWTAGMAVLAVNFTAWGRDLAPALLAARRRRRYAPPCLPPSQQVSTIAWQREQTSLPRSSVSRPSHTGHAGRSHVAGRIVPLLHVQRSGSVTMRSSPTQHAIPITTYMV